MTQLTLLTKAVLIYVCIGIIFVGFGYNVASNPANVFITKTSNGNYNYTQSVNDALPTSSSMSRTTGLWSIIDSLASVLSFISLLTINVVFFPLAFLTTVELPALVVLLFGAPLFLLLMFGIVYLVRSGQ